MLVDSHEERTELGIGDARVTGWNGRGFACGGVIAGGSDGDHGADEITDLRVGELGAGALAKDQVESVDG